MRRFWDWLLRRPKDRWPEWRPDQILTPENRTITGSGVWNTNVITIRITDPIFYTAPNGDRVQVLPDGTEVRFGKIQG